MAEFKKLIITKKGQEALNDATTSSEHITFKQISSSSRIYTDEEILNLENLEDIKQTVDVSNVQKIDADKLQIEGVIDNTKLVEGYKLNTLGLIISFNGQDILYGVSCVTSEDKGVYMPAFNGRTPTATVIRLINNISNIDEILFKISQIGNATITDLLELTKKVEELKEKVRNQIIVSEEDPEQEECIWYQILNSVPAQEIAEIMVEVADTYDANSKYQLETITNMTDDENDQNKIIEKEE